MFLPALVRNESGDVLLAEPLLHRDQLAIGPSELLCGGSQEPVDFVRVDRPGTTPVPSRLAQPASSAASAVLMG